MLLRQSTFTHGTPASVACCNALCTPGHKKGEIFGFFEFWIRLQQIEEGTLLGTVAEKSLIIAGSSQFIIFELSQKISYTVLEKQLAIAPGYATNTTFRANKKRFVGDKILGLSLG